MPDKHEAINVLYVILSFEIGGMEQVVSDLILSIDKKKFSPIVVCLNSLGPIASELESRGIKIIKLPPMMPVLSYLFPLQLIRIIRKYQISVVHTQSGCWHKAAIAGFWGGVNTIVYTDHGRHVPDIKKIMLLDRLYSFITDHVVGVSQELADYMANAVGVSRAKVSCIINGIDINKFEPAQRTQKDFADRIGIIARLAPVKDISTLLHSIKLLHDRGMKVSLTVAGDGPERELLEKLAVSLDVNNSVTFLGFRRDIVNVLSEMDIFVLCSISEGTSITLLEAMAAGKPVVVTNVGGNPAIIKDGINGLLVLPKNPELLADALSRLISDKALREQMSVTNINTVHQNYSLRSMAAAYEKLYGAQ